MVDVSDIHLGSVAGALLTSLGEAYFSRRLEKSLVRDEHGFPSWLQADQGPAMNGQDLWQALDFSRPSHAFNACCRHLRQEFGYWNEVEIYKLEVDDRDG